MLQHLLYARHSVTFSTHMSSFHPHKLGEVGVVFIPTLPGRQVKHRVVKGQAQGQELVSDGTVV